MKVSKSYKIYGVHRKGKEIAFRTDWAPEASGGYNECFNTSTSIYYQLTGQADGVRGWAGFNFRLSMAIPDMCLIDLII